MYTFNKCTKLVNFDHFNNSSQKCYIPIFIKNHSALPPPPPPPEFTH